MIVAFDRLAHVSATAINASAPHALGPTGDADRPTVYDPTWGYFTFGQRVNFTYDDEAAYQDEAQFTIEGVFTRGAEMGEDGDDLSVTDEAGFTAIVGKYRALEALLATAARAEPPAAYEQWGTEDDARCIRLPAPLVDRNGNPVFGMPVSISISATQFPLELRYQCVLREAREYPVKLSVNGHLLDQAIVNILPPEPEFARHRIVGCSGEVLQLKHYKAMEVDVSGLLPLNTEGDPMGPAGRRVAAALESGTLDLEVVRRGAAGEVAEKLPFYGTLHIVDDPVFEADYREQVLAIGVRARR
jgi:hypothetical protein